MLKMETLPGDTGKFNPFSTGEKLLFASRQILLGVLFSN
jgi:hypothetical protein